MRPYPPRPRRGPAALAFALSSILSVACEGDHVKVLPTPPPDLSGAWDTGVTVTAGTCEELYVGVVTGRILTLRQADGALLAQANAGDWLNCGPVRSCGSGALRDGVVTLSLTGSVAFDTDCTLEFSEEITGIVGRGIVPEGSTMVPATLDPQLRVDGRAVIDVRAVGTCPVGVPCRFEGGFTAVPRGACPPGFVCPAVISCFPPWECVVPL